jgi:hypothetical protein
MGAVFFSLDRRLVDFLQRAIPLTVFVETGTFRGDTIAEVADCFDEVHTVELSDELFREACGRFADRPHVQVHQGESAPFLAKIRQQIAGRCALYWLDAHWCVAQATAGQTSQCPLLDELAALKPVGDTAVILIDDARLYLCPPPDPHEVSQWPSWQQILDSLQQLSSRHEMMVVNDVIAFYPSTARTVMHEYARSHAVDWLQIMHRYQHAEELRQRCQQQQQSLRQIRDRMQRQSVRLEELQAKLRRARKQQS